MAARMKPVTAAAVLQLVDAGRLDLDEDVNAYLTSWRLPNNGSWQPRVTLRQLLCHGAGLTVHGFPGYLRDAELPTLQQVLAGQKPANSDPIRVNALPGTQYRYSGGGYCILQQVLMDVTGKPFPTLMRELVLDPLNMTQSTHEQPLPVAAAAASGHRTGGKPIAGKWSVYAEMAAAGLWTTPSDLLRFALAIQHALAGHADSFLSQTIVQQMLSPQVEPFVGLGWQLDGKDASLRFSHTGGNEGFRCILVAYARQGFGASVMTNADAGMIVIEQVMAALAHEYDWPAYLPHRDSMGELDPTIYAAYVGEYELKPGFTFTVRAQNNELTLQPTGQSALTLHPVNANTFLLQEVDAEIVFARDGEHNSLTFKQNDREMVAPKVK